MLTGLHISNIALIDSQELVFGPGFTVLTGETGAGKSILLDALDALTGGGQPQRLLRDGCVRDRSKPVLAGPSPCGSGAKPKSLIWTMRRSCC